MAINRVERKGDGVRAIRERLRKPGTVEVGVIDAGLHGGSEETVASIAFQHEFGTREVPERSFMRSTIREKRKEIIALQKKLLARMENGDMIMKEALGFLGEFVRDAISQKIVTLQEPPNAPETILRKGSSNPLIDTGQLKNSVTYEVIL